MLYNILTFVFSIIIVFAVIWTNNHLRLEKPARRLALGCTGLCIAIAALVMFALLPKPVSLEDSPMLDATIRGACLIWSGVLVFSLWQIAGGCIQAFKRWRYYRHQASSRH